MRHNDKKSKESKIKDKNKMEASWNAIKGSSNVLFLILAFFRFSLLFFVVLLFACFALIIIIILSHFVRSIFTQFLLHSASTIYLFSFLCPSGSLILHQHMLLNVVSLCLKVCHTLPLFYILPFHSL